MLVIPTHATNNAENNKQGCGDGDDNAFIARKQVDFAPGNNANDLFC